MQPDVFIYLCISGLLGYARAYSGLLDQSDDSDLFFDDQLIDPMQFDELVNPMIDPDVDPNGLLEEAINLDQDPSLLGNINEYCSSPDESPDSLIEKIRVRRGKCSSPKPMPPSPKVNLPSLNLPEEPEPQTPLFRGFPIRPPFIRNPQCYDKLPYCCPSGRMPDNTFPGCKVCEKTSSSSHLAILKFKTADQTILRLIRLSNKATMVMHKSQFYLLLRLR